MTDPKKRRITIKDLAQAAGASNATVSFVLNGSWEKHRINADTAARIRTLADEMGYVPNQKARALRMNRSSLAGMIIPHHRNRFFAGLVENFEREARARKLIPIVGSTQRDAAIEAQVTRALIAQEVELLVIAGVENPTAINRLCAEKGVRCVNVDLPGAEAFSVVTDNFGGAHALTRRLLTGLPPEAQVCFLGGRENEYATDLRVQGFRGAVEDAGIARSHVSVLRCGYAPDAARAEVGRFCARFRAAPMAILVNSITAFEGFVGFWRALPDPKPDIRLACFDWDPFAAALPLDTVMLRQDVEELMAACFTWFDGDAPRAGEILMVPPTLAVNDLAEGTPAREGPESEGA